MFRNKLNQKVFSILIIIIIINAGLLIFLPLNPKVPIIDAESTWTQSTDIDFGNGTMDNTTVIGTGENAELRINLSELDHWTEKLPANRPTAKSQHGMATIYETNNVVVFGGVPNNAETWVYNVNNNTWMKMNPNTKPSARYANEMAGIYGHDKALSFGSMWYDDVTWVYDFSEDNWTNKNPSTKPFPRRYHAMSSVYGDDKVVVFGGWPNRNDTWVYDLSSNTWSQKTPTNAPSRRYYHAIAPVWGTDKILLFGGYDQSIWVDQGDTWIYDISDDKWTQLTFSNKPSARRSHGLAPICGTDKVLLFGGRTNANYFYETWVFDLSDTTWTKKTPMNQNNNPNAADSHEMACVNNTDKVVLYGGYGIGGQKNETWVYKHFLSLKNGTYVSGKFDTCANSSFKTLCWECEVQNFTTIKFQLKTAADEPGLSSCEFVGPDGTTSSYYNCSGESIWSGHEGERWLQYKVYFNMNIFTESPILKDVTITYNCLPNTIVIGPSNGSLLTINKPTFKWTFEDYDSLEQEAFQVLIDDDLDFENVSYDTGERSSEERRWEFPTGTSYAELPDGEWYWKVRTKDEDGTWTEYSKPWSFTIDTKTPSSSPTFPINDAFYNSVPEISGIAFDPTDGSGVTKVEIVVKQLSNNYYWNGTSWVPLTTWLPASGTNNWTYDSSNITWQSDTRYNVQSRAVDLGNNIELPDAGNVFNIDKDNPFSSITYPINDTWLKKLEQISGSSADIGGSGVNKVEISIQRASDNNYWDGMRWKLDQSWLNTEGSNLWSYNSSETKWYTNEKYILTTRATDETGNRELPSAGITFKYDDSPPEPLSIYINNGDEFTISTSVQLSLGAEDFGSGITDMAFSTDGLGWSDWEEFNTTKDNNLPTGDGEKTVYFKVRDLTGNIAEPVSDTIILDTSPSTKLSIIINDGDEYTTSDIAMLTLNAFDLMSGLKDVAFSFKIYTTKCTFYAF